MVMVSESYRWKHPYYKRGTRRQKHGHYFCLQIGVKELRGDYANIQYFFKQPCWLAETEALTCGRGDKDRGSKRFGAGIALPAHDGSENNE